jgi:cephalosporin-C deacetylase
MPTFDIPLEELRGFKPALTRQPDFDGFWRETLDEAATLSLDPTFTRIDYPVRAAEVYDVRYTGWGGARIGGWYLKPSGPGPYPAVTIYHGYSGSRGFPHVHLPWVVAGYAVLAVDVRGQSGVSPDTSTYTSGHMFGWMTQGILDPCEYYYRGVYVDCVRALDALAARPEVDMKRVAVHGISQGGGLTLAVAGLDHRPACAMPDVPYLCHFRRAVDVAEAGPFLEIANYVRQNTDSAEQVFRTVTYFDAMNLAPQIQCPTLMSVALVDKVCPPSTDFAAFNHLTCIKEVRTYPYWEHADIPAHFVHKLEWAEKYLG